MHESLSIVGILIAALVVSCSHARVVSVQPGRGGTIALCSPDSAGARAKGSQIMAENCPEGRHEIVQEGETVVGSRSSTPLKGWT